MLLDPLEEQFHPPSVAIQFGDSEGRQIEIVGKKDEQLVVFNVVELHSPQVDRIVLAGMGASEPDGLIAAQAGCLVDGVRINTSILQIGFGTRDEESLGLMQDIEPSEIDITAIHDIETAGLESQLIENIHIPQLAVRDVNEGRNRSAQIEQRMQFYRALRFAEARPRKECQTQVDGARV